MTAVIIACLLTCGGAAADQQSRNVSPQRPQATPSAMGLQGYSVVLVVGDMQTAGGGDTVPPAARKALTDMQAFLPYKRYQLLDAAWMLCCGMYRSAVTGRMRGPDEREYSYSIETLSGDDAKLTVRFSMRESAAPGAASSRASATSGSAVGGTRSSGQSSLSDTARAEYSRQLYEAQKDRDDAEIQLRKTRQMAEVGTATKTELEAATTRYQLARSRCDDLERTLNPARSSPFRPYLLDNTFSIAVGETVVIGTSRLKGDQALIALLTAAGKPASR